MENEKDYIFNLETTKIELHFDKAEYSALSEDDKKNLKGAFLFSGKSKCWVSRAKEPNLWRAKLVAKELGFTNEVRVGERLSFAEQLEKKVERSEQKAERYEKYSENAAIKAENLKKPLEAMNGDIAFFTQPIIPGHVGSQSFAKQRDKLFDNYGKGIEESEKSMELLEKAEELRKSAVLTELNDENYLNSKIKECDKEIRKRSRNIDVDNEILQEMRDGKKYMMAGKIITEEEINNSIKRENELIEVSNEKKAYFVNRLKEINDSNVIDSSITEEPMDDIEDGFQFRMRM